MLDSILNKMEAGVGMYEANDGGIARELVAPVNQLDELTLIGFSYGEKSGNYKLADTGIPSV